VFFVLFVVRLMSDQQSNASDLSSSVGVLGRDRCVAGLTTAHVLNRAAGVPELVLQGADLGDVGRVVVRIVPFARRRVADR
jgi:hypothetical protein